MPQAATAAQAGTWPGRPVWLSGKISCSAPAECVQHIYRPGQRPAHFCSC
jgi:hypothetical protein